MVILLVDGFLLTVIHGTLGFSADATCQLDITHHDRDALRVDGAQLSVFEEADQVGFGRFLQRQDGRRLEAEVFVEVLGDLAHQTLEGQHAKKKPGRLLVVADLAQRHGAYK